MGRGRGEWTELSPPKKKLLKSARNIRGGETPPPGFLPPCRASGCGMIAYGRPADRRWEDGEGRKTGKEGIGKQG